ncbi:MAG: glucosaminidase domain-containing protein, partial [Clostridium sp.]
MKKKKQISIVLLIALIFNILPTIGVQASQKDMNIVSKTPITVKEAKEWAKSKNATETFIGLADIFWSMSEAHGGVNPAIAYVQSAKETGYGRFGGVLDESYKNPCGMKNPEGGADDDAGAHKRFDTWEDGVQAQLDHLALYAGAEGYPRANTTDPRHFPYLKGKAKTVSQLGGNWAPSATYGTEILNMYYDMLSKSENAKMHGEIELPKLNESFTDTTILVKGWALNPSGIKEVRVYLNNELKGNAKIGITRNDIASRFPTYPGSSTSGYELQVNIGSLNAGKAVVKVEQVGNDGSINTITRNFEVEKLETIGRIDIPRGDEVGSNKLRVAGWALSQAGVKEIKVYVDGKLRGTTAPNVNRPDVNNAYSEYKNSPKAGFDITVDISDIKTGGTKKVVAEVISNDNSVKKLESTVLISKLETIGRIDVPREDTVLSNEVRVGGWALSPTGIKEIKVYIEGKFKKSIMAEVERPDVVNIYPQYGSNTKVGFNTYVDISDITTGGSKNVAVEIIGNDNSIKTLNSTFVVDKLEAIGRIDIPRGDEINSTKVRVGGWVLMPSGVEKINYYIDGNLKLTGKVNVERPDVVNVYPQYGSNKMVGFNEYID